MRMTSARCVPARTQPRPGGGHRMDSALALPPGPVLHLVRMIRPLRSAFLVLIVLPGWLQDARANPSAGCDAPLSQQLPADPGLCLRQADLALPASPAEPAFRALVEKAGEQIEAGRFDTALRALACAEVVGGDDPALRNELMRNHGNLEYYAKFIEQQKR